ncbi:MAG: type 4a pilus biogenesis protein PilO [Myxococcota bacterium]|nr:type 4a pilus biogenesis protein PilO [Myxococcota bacterium]
MNGLQKLTEAWGATAQKQRLLIGIFAPVAVFAIFYFVALSGVEGDLTEVVSAIDKEKRNQADLQVEIHNRHVLEQEFKLKQAKVAEVERQIPMEADPGDLLDKVYEEASASRLDLRVFRPEAELRVKEMAFIINRADFAGGYHSVGEFLDRISHLERLIKVLAIHFKVDMSMAAKNEERISNQLVGSATIAAFRLLKDEEIESLTRNKKRRGGNR